MYYSTYSSMISYLASYMLVSLILVILMIVAYWKIFSKAGEAGWKAIIPIYNSYIVFKIAWRPLMFGISIALSVLYVILFTIGFIFEYSTGGSMLLAVLPILLIVIAVINIMLLHKLSKAFGHGVGFTLGLIFLNIIFLFILAFGSSQYVRYNENPEADAPSQVMP